MLENEIRKTNPFLFSPQTSCIENLSLQKDLEGLLSFLLFIPEIPFAKINAKYDTEVTIS